MTTIQGSDVPDGFGRVMGYGVLGTGTPSTIQEQDGPVAVNSVGVWGVTGTAADLSNIQDVSDNFSQTLTAAIYGQNALQSGGVAVYGETRQFNGVQGAHGFLGGRSPFAGEETGAFGQASQRGVIGIASAAGGIGVYGGSVGGTGTGVAGEAGDHNFGVLGRSNAASGVGVRAENTAGGLAAEFVGDVKFEGRVVGDLSVSGDVFLENGDIAERFAVAPSAGCQPGMVLSIGASGSLVPCSVAYDRRVVGVVSGAGSLAPAVTLRQSNAAPANAVVALVGTVYCLADADRAPIEMGDLLTSSDTIGHAMKASDPARSFGAVLGKALAGLRTGRALIPMVVALQ